MKCLVCGYDARHEGEPCSCCGSLSHEAPTAEHPEPAPSLSPDAVTVVVDTLNTVGGVAGGIAVLKSLASEITRRLSRRRSSRTLDEARLDARDAIERTFGVVVSTDPQEVDVDGGQFTFTWVDRRQEFKAMGRLDKAYRQIKVTMTQS